MSPSSATRPRTLHYLTTVSFLRSVKQGTVSGTHHPFLYIRGQETQCTTVVLSWTLKWNIKSQITIRYRTLPISCTSGALLQTVTYSAKPWLSLSNIQTPLRHLVTVWLNVTNEWGKTQEASDMPGLFVSHADHQQHRGFVKTTASTVLQEFTQDVVTINCDINLSAEIDILHFVNSKYQHHLSNGRTILPQLLWLKKLFLTALWMRGAKGGILGKLALEED